MKQTDPVCIPLLASLFLLFLSSTLPAQESDLYGAGGRERGMGATGVAGVKGHSSLYYNPAGLTRTYTLNGRLDISGLFGSSSVSSTNADFNADAEGEVGSSGFLGIGLASPVSMDECPTCQKDNAMIAHDCPVCGTTLPAAQESVWYDALYWGFWVEFPVTSGTGVQITSDQQNPEWAQYGRASSRLAASVGMGYKINDWVSAGLSMTLFYISNGVINNEINAFNPGEYSNITVDQGVDFAGSLNLGLLFAVTEDIDLGFCFRSERAGQTNSDSSTKLETVIIGTTTEFLIRSTTGFSPVQVALGIHWEINDDWNVAFDLTWMNWSEYEGPYSFLTTGGGTGATAMPHTPADYSDIIVPRIGVEYIINETWKVRGGYGFRPNPAPDQDGLMNIIDSSSHMVTFGVEYKINQTLYLDGFLQVHIFNEQSTTEDPSRFPVFENQPNPSPPPLLIDIPVDPVVDSWSATGTFFMLGFSFNFVL